MDYKHALKLLEDGEGKLVSDYFKENNHPLEYGYSLLLNGELEFADMVMSPLTSTRAEWAVVLISYLTNAQKKYPTYFQIRNFLEIDLSLFFKYNQLSYVHKILDNVDTFQDINAESYKFTARALLKNNYPQVAKIFMDKSLRDYYKDIELHYLYAEFYLAQDDKENALKAVNTCLRINPNYYPAVKTYKELNNIN